MRDRRGRGYPPGLRGLPLQFVARMPVALLGNPFEVVVAGACVITGVPYVLTGTGPASVEAALPLWLVRAWGVELLVGGVLILIGVLARRKHVERAGLHLLGASALAYGLVMLLILGIGAAAAAALIVGVGLACFARAAVISAALRIAAALASGERRDDDGDDCDG